MSYNIDNCVTEKKMTELKTLKDLEQGEHTIFTKTEPKIYYVNTNDLRQEAIKYIKGMSKADGYNEHFCLTCGFFSTNEIGWDFYKFHNEKQDSTNHKLISNIAYETSDIRGAIEILKHFFNITDEDLK